MTLLAPDKDGLTFTDWVAIVESLSRVERDSVWDAIEELPEDTYESMRSNQSFVLLTEALYYSAEAKYVAGS